MSFCWVSVFNPLLLNTDSDPFRPHFITMFRLAKFPLAAAIALSLYLVPAGASNASDVSGSRSSRVAMDSGAPSGDNGPVFTVVPEPSAFMLLVSSSLFGSIYLIHRRRK